MSIYTQSEAVDAEMSGSLGRDNSQPTVGIGVNPNRSGRGLFAAASVYEISEWPRPAQVVGAPHAERLDFEQLVGELSMRFIDLPSTDVDAAIQDGQRRIVEALDLDRSTMFQFSDDGNLLATHSWWRYRRSVAAPTHVGQGEFPVDA